MMLMDRKELDVVEYIVKHMGLFAKWRMIFTILLITVSVWGISIYLLDAINLIDTSEMSTYLKISICILIASIFGVMGKMLWQFNKAYPKYVEYNRNQ